MSWKPVPRPDVDVFNLPLDAQQGYLLSRLDGATDVSALASVTGFSPERLEGMLRELVSLGAIAPGPETSPEARPPVGQEAPEPPQDEPPSEAESAADRAEAATHRKLFEQALRHRTEDERAGLARRAEEPELSAYCFDPVAQVVQAVFENPRAGLVHARLVATHHRTSVGLEAVASRAPFAGDPGVRRALLQNPQLPPGIYRRLWSSSRLLEQFLVCVSHDAPEQTRHIAREVLRASFGQRTGEERVELILTSEGRCLTLFAGLTIDGQTTALLCRRSYVSNILIQNIARWSAAPPQLIAHLRKQDVVRRNPQLRMMLQRHPNAS